jgi:citrate lyase subunit beta/citryl-CoA lyase
VLYMPSSNERALEKAKTLPVDGLILDLEDAVGPTQATARERRLRGRALGEYGRAR